MYALFFAVMISGALLRFTHVNWDSYLSFHPDERNIAWAVTRIHFWDQMNPKFFAYGGLPIYLYRAIGEGIVAVTKDKTWIMDWGHISVLGRYVSATLSTISILLIYLVGSYYFSRAAGLTAAFLLTFSPWAIREAHFSTTETMLVFFLLLLALLSHKVISLVGSGPTRLQVGTASSADGRYYILLGIVQGLALGAKTTSLLFTLIPLTAFLVILRSTPIKSGSMIHDLRSLRQRIKAVAHLGLLGMLFLLTTAIFFLATSPYTVLDLTHFLESMRYETAVALGNNPVPYTLSFTGTLPYLYQIETMIWQAGIVPILGFVGMISLIAAVVAQFIARHKTARTEVRYYMILLVFPIIYFAWNGTWFAKFSRYNVPILPFLTLFAAWLLVFLFSKIPKKSFYWSVGVFVYLIIGLFQLGWGLANWTIYLRPQTRVAASEWIYQNIPQRVLIYIEHWNDGLPVDLPSRPSGPYNRELLTVYDEDGPQKLDYYATTLPKAEYIILSTRRMWAVMPKLGVRYPLTKKLYAKLLAGDLGYTEVRQFTSYPSLLGITIPDETVEESFQIFDHPTVRIFQNTERFDGETIKRTLNER